MNSQPSARRLPWEQGLTLAVAAVIGVYAGVAAGLFSSCIRFAQIVCFRSGDVLRDLADPRWARLFASELRGASWHLEFALLALLLLFGSTLLASGRLGLPRFEADRLRAVALAGAFGLALYYPLLCLNAFDATFPEGEGGLFALAAAAPWWLRVLAPALGGLAAGLLLRYVSPESGGHGVLEVIEAVHVRSAQIRGRVAVWKSVAAGMVIGSGGSAGREGPVVHLGGAVASALSRFLRMPRERSALFLACGAGAGIAASFHAPLAGALFAIEIVLGGELVVRSVAPVVLSAVTATVTARALVHGKSDLVAGGWALRHPAEIGLHLVLGVAAGFTALAYIRSIDGVHHFFDRRLARLRPELKPALGGLLLGLLALLAPRALGTGIESMNAALAGELALPVLLVALVAKIAGTGLTLGSGAPGGSFFPAVFTGAMLGGAFGQLVHLFLPGADPAAYAAVGMGAVVAGSASAPLTGVFMMFELTGNYQIVLPLLVACGIAAAQVQWLLGGSIYTLQLNARGIAVGGRDKMLRGLSVLQAMEKVDPVPEGLGWPALVQLVSDTPHAAFPVVAADGRVSGLLSVRDVRAALLEPLLSQLAVARDLAATNPVRVASDDDLEEALRRIPDGGAAEAVVLGEGERPLGVLTREAVLDAWRRATG